MELLQLMNTSFELLGPAVDVETDHVRLFKLNMSYWRELVE